MTLLVTGATGYIGRALLAHCVREGRDVVAVARRIPADAGGRWLNVGDIGSKTDWFRALSGVKQVVHLAARVHVMREINGDPGAAFAEVNFIGTVRLAQAAAVAGVRRFVFVSTVKVHGEGNPPSRPFRETDPLAPADAYARSKCQAERELANIAARSGMDVAILRPPLVYGPGVGANFLRLLRWVEQGLPLPFASIRNRRSLVYVGNLVDAILRCTDDPRAVGQTFLVADDEALSTPQLIRALALASGRQPRLFPFPPLLLRLLAAALGRQGEIDRLCGSLVVDTHHLRRTLDWKPPYATNQGLSETVEWYRRTRVGGRQRLL